MVELRKAVVSLVAIVVLSAVAISIVTGGLFTGEGNAGDVPEQSAFSQADTPTQQVNAVLSQLYYVDHTQRLSAELDADSDGQPEREVSSVTIVSHSSEEIFTGYEIQSQDRNEVVYRYVGDEFGYRAEAAVGQALTTPGTVEWEEIESRYSQDGAVPNVSADVEWSVAANSTDRLVVETTTIDGYQSVVGEKQIVFDSLSQESVYQVAIDTETGRVVEIADTQVGVFETDSGTIRGPFTFTKVVKFEYDSVDLPELNTD